LLCEGAFMSGLPESNFSSLRLTDNLEALCQRFEQAWQDGRRPALADFLPPTDPERWRALAELARLDLEYRFKAGESPRVETYLEAYPELAANQAVVLDLIEAEYGMRRRRADVPIQEFLERFPAYLAAMAGRLPGVPVPSTAVEKRSTAAGLASAGSKTVDITTPNVPGYEVLEELGRGGMGRVYKARQLALNRLVALKMLRNEALAETEELARFRREAETVARLRHPNVVQIYEVNEYHGHPYFSMEFVEGGTLAARLAGKPQPPAEAARLVEILARAVHAVHECGVIHRDLKPGNVLMTADGTPKVADFGLARRLEGDGLSTSVGRVMGTPPYMAPEQARGDTKAISAASDVYALGALLYEMLTGRPPFQAASVWDTIRQVLTTEAVPPRRLQPKVPADLETICLKCLEKEPAKRYASAQALAEDLGRYGRGEPIRARPSGLVERAWKWARRRPAVAALLAALLLVVVGSLVGLTTLWLRAKRERDRAEERFRMALQVVEKLKEVSESPELKARGLEEWRRKLLESATDFYQLLSRAGADDATVRAEQGKALRQLADLLNDLGRRDEAEGMYKQARSVFEELAAGRPTVADYRRELAISNNSLGSLYLDTGKAEQAEPTHQKALSLWQELAGAHPGEPSYREGEAVTYNALALLYHETGRDEPAREAWEKARDLLQELVARDPAQRNYVRKLATAHTNLGSLSYQSRKLDQAEKAYDQALALSRRLAEAEPQAPESQRDLADAHSNLGLVYTATGRADQAERAFAEAIRLQEPLARTHPDVPDYRLVLARSYNNLGDLCFQVERYAQAEEAFIKARDSHRRLAEAYSETPEYRRDLALAEYNLGEVYRCTGRAAQAEGAYQQAQQTFEWLVEVTPQSLEYSAFLAGSLAGRGAAVREGGKTAEALELVGRAAQLLQGVLAKDASHAQAGEFLLGVRGEQAVTLARMGRAEEAIRALRQLTDLDKGQNRPEVRAYRSLVWSRTGEPVKAATEAAEAAKDKSLPARTLYDLARALAGCAAAVKGEAAQKYAGEAVALLRRADATGYFRLASCAERLRSDKDFAPLAARQDFQVLLRQLPAAAPDAAKGP
jgi:tetratricopeptide (TPR) repeat protein/tRNA A-37 threonylcarbamoyl transferase component Bud32